MEGLVIKFDLDKFKVGNVVKISSKKLSFEGSCLIVQASTHELNLAYYDKERGSMEYQALTIEDVKHSDYEIKFLN
ncbi:hypothetical protein KGF41_00170 [Clostridioides sp. ZZV14-6150]|uniref:hypothetical protein n=1 Tax=Clostridioides sp. ZZV14-6150 TaxID=2811493 RepID=UPI001D113371|nr:hypothetical protein [Clostridioides sp. ZZV14-6150]